MCVKALIQKKMLRMLSARSWLVYALRLDQIGPENVSTLVDMAGEGSVGDLDYPVQPPVAKPSQYVSI